MPECLNSWKKEDHEVDLWNSMSSKGKSSCGRSGNWGAKNAALAILTAAIMTDESVVIENLPDVSDINVLLEAIAEIGATVDRIDRHTVRINASTIGDLSVDYEYIKKIRASYYLLGALLGKYKRAEVPLPGDATSESSDRSAYQRISCAGSQCGD